MPEPDGPMTAISDFSGTPKETSLRICLPPSTVTVRWRAEKETSPVSTNSSSRSPTRRNVEWPTPTMSFGPMQRGAGLGSGWPLTYVPLWLPRSRISKRPSGRRVELGVVAGDLEVGDDQLVLQRTADAHHPAEVELVERGRAAVAVDRRRPRARRRGPAAAGTVCAAPLLLRHCGCCGCLLLRRRPAAALLRAAAAPGAGWPGQPAPPCAAAAARRGCALRAPAPRRR